MPPRLTRQRFAAAVDALSAADRDLAAIRQRFGAPPLWPREPGFATLVFLILEQQVSLASARATYQRLVALIGPPAPDTLLALSDEALRAAGFSRQKTRYGRALAEAVACGALDLDHLPRMADEEVRAALTAIVGIGDWTADIYLLQALKRPDVWPTKDLALAVAAQEIKDLAERPGTDALEAIGEAWRPHRAVAARFLWHYYLSTRGQSGDGAI